MRAVNLLPRDEPKRRKTQMTIGTQLALVSPFVIASLIVAGFLLESSKVNDNRATLKALQQELADLPAPSVAPQEDNSQLVLQQTQRVAALSSALQARVAWDRVLREISAVLPEDVWLITLSAKSPSAAPAPAPVATPPPAASGDGTTTTETTPAPAPAPIAPVGSGASLDVSGYTYSQEGVARFLGRLAVIPELQNVKLLSAVKATSEGRDVVQFSVTAEIRSQAGA